MEAWHETRTWYRRCQTITQCLVFSGNLSAWLTISITLGVGEALDTFFFFNFDYLSALDRVDA